MLLPQVVLYAVVACSLAVMNAHRRFALGAAAPAVENLGCIAVLVAAGLLFPRTDSLDIPTGELLLLGLGTTAAVALHAPCSGGVRGGGRHPAPPPGLARRRGPGAGAPLATRARPGRPRRGAAPLRARRGQPGRRGRRGLPARAQLLLPADRPGRHTGGAVPAAAALTAAPARRMALFRDTAVRGLRFGLFVSAPAAVALAVLAPVLASAASFGRMLTDGGALLVAAGLVALAPGVVGETAFLVGTYSCYARGDTRSPLRAMGVKTGICLAILAAPCSRTDPRRGGRRGRGLGGRRRRGRVLRPRPAPRPARPGEARARAAHRRGRGGDGGAAGPGRAPDVRGIIAGQGGRFVALAGAVAACLVGGATYVGAEAAARPRGAWLLGALRGRRVDPLASRGPDVTAVPLPGVPRPRVVIAAALAAVAAVGLGAAVAWRPCSPWAGWWSSPWARRSRRTRRSRPTC